MCCRTANFRANFRELILEIIMKIYWIVISAQNGRIPLILLKSVDKLWVMLLNFDTGYEWWWSKSK